MALIKHDAVAPTELWTTVDAGEPIPATGDILVDPARWVSQGETLRARADKVGVLLQPDDDVLTLEGTVEGLAIVAVAFPKFTDGRGYSSARLLRDRLGYTGELRAVGHVLPDQVFYMRRVGFDALELADGKSAETAIAQLETFSVRYQAGADDSRPLFRRVARPA